MDEFQEEATANLTHQFEALTISSEEELRNRAKKVFGSLMLKAFGTKGDKSSKFQPCIDDLDFLKKKGPVLCKTLRMGTLTNFCKTLHPFERDEDETSNLGRKDSIFHLHGNKLEDDIKEFKDLTLRANVLAEVIKAILDEKPLKPVEVRLLDGHGRMLVCLIRALMNLDVDLDKLVKLGRLVLKVFEIDDLVHKYHQYVFPMCVSKCKESIIAMRKDPPYPPDSFNNNVVYLNFCSVKSGGDRKAWKSYFETQTIDHDNWVPHCCKENVLKYIWKIVHPPYRCTVMVSLVIKHMSESDSLFFCNFYPKQSNSTLVNYITGLGLLSLLRDEALFNAKIVSVRPKDEIVWHDSEERRQPERLKSGKWGNPFVTLLVRPMEANGNEELKKLEVQFDDWKIADLLENTMQIGALVRVKEGKHEGRHGIITKRTPATVGIDFRSASAENIDVRVGLHSCELVSKPRVTRARAATVPFLKTLKLKGYVTRARAATVPFHK